MSIRDEITTNLRRAFQPDLLKVEDQSDLHRGHAGWREGGETHFKVTISATAFKKMNRLQRHRSIHEAVTKPVMKRIHALSITILNV